MYAVIASGGKQYRVAAGDIIKIEKLAIQLNDVVEFDKVLMLADGENIQIGTPYLEDIKIKGEVLNHGRHKKINILKFKRRKHHMKQMGHRQNYTEVKITEVGDGKITPKKSTSKKEAITKKTKVKKEIKQTEEISEK
jgi:large subunit ribosomal protein L21